jgi:hypothetical protein
MRCPVCGRPFEVGSPDMPCPQCAEEYDRYGNVCLVTTVLLAVVGFAITVRVALDVATWLTQ